MHLEELTPPRYTWGRWPSGSIWPAWLSPNPTTGQQDLVWPILAFTPSGTFWSSWRDWPCETTPARTPRLWVVTGYPRGALVGSQWGLEPDHTHSNEHLPVKLMRQRGLLYDTLKPPESPGWMKKWCAARKEKQRFVFLVWFLFSFGVLGIFFLSSHFFFFLLACLVLFSFMVWVGNAGVRKEYGGPEGERIGVYDVKPPKIQ